MTTTHFPKIDPRFCGTRQAPRQYTVHAEKVTCNRCLGTDDDMLILTPQGEKTLREIETGAWR